MNNKDFNTILKKVDEILPPRAFVGFQVGDTKPTVFDSKVGGVPYFPKSRKYPTIDDKPLLFIAQFNLDGIKLEGFPTTGILQFFVADEDAYGLEFGSKKSRFKVIYHKKIIQDTEKLIDTVQNSPNAPYSGEFLLVPKNKGTMKASAWVEKFEQAFVQAYEELLGEKCKGMLDCGLTDKQEEKLYERNDYQCDFWLGGYPVFAQYDPRYEKRYLNHDILLFESDSFYDRETKREMMWGDSGTCTFFIKPEDLEKRDFSNVFFSWDCC